MYGFISLNRIAKYADAIQGWFLKMGFSFAIPEYGDYKGPSEGSTIQGKPGQIGGKH